ncbi:stage II sporulation protein E [Caldisalinibacter kiritimatiensis]|uniref:Stage II sporulation serine phosphatase for sigma-F activation (SpoIIE) n=1 Tax=Caldisalinibacter kiritimatiensis TaxID=1304284 RepID=R1CFQ6_9FIRM|nr:stage II sporulation protein E [Caldisalinibacter kiritimatiensis]EOD01140.1 Stage II sporulation serine phosphatase for sigma-F activation (SpoIIE) [Caldisalinibacter kiritimatiensis]
MINKMELLSTKAQKNRQGLFNQVKKQLFNVSFNDVVIYLMALFISRASIMDGLTPFGIALAAVYLYKYGHAFWISIICSLGIISYQGTNSYQYILIYLTLLLVYGILNKKIKFTTFKMALMSSVITVTLKSVIVMASDYYFYNIVMAVFEGLIVFSLTYIFNYSIDIIDGNYDRPYTSEELICGAIMLALVVSGFNSINILGISLSNVVAVLLVVLFAYIKGPTMGATVGVTIGIVTSMSTPDMPLVISVYGFAGLLAGLFKELGRLGSSIGFIMGISIMAFYIDGFTESIVQLQETAVGIGIFIIVLTIIQRTRYKNILLKLGNVSVLQNSYKDRIKDITYKRLDEFSKVFEELATTFERVSDKEKIVEQKDISKFIDNIVNDTCKKCPMYKFCWVNDFYTTYNSMFEVLTILELEGDITEEEFSKIFNNRCIKEKEVIQKAKYLFDMYKVNYKWENKLLESRQLVAEQLQGVSKIIKDLAKEVQQNVIFKEKVEIEIYSQLRKNGINVKEVIVTESLKDNFEIILEVKASNYNENIVDRVIPIVSNTVGFEVVKDKFYSNNFDNKKRIKFKLIKANRFGAITKVCKVDESFNYISGDSYTFGESNNSYYVALSDGMGVGQKANQESDITISLLEKFLEAGFDRELALKTINSMLVLKSDDEMLSTIDMAMIDLFNGESKFIKTGAAPTFIKKKDRVEIVNSNTLPLGILKDVDFKVYEHQLEDGDLVIMMSDGVLDANRELEDKETWMEEIIEEINGFNPQSVAQQIIEKSKEVCGGVAKDDMTVLVTKVWKRRKN